MRDDTSENTPNSTVTDPGEKLFDLRDDVPLRNTVRCVFPFVVMFGAYVLLAGHLGPGGGFSGGAILGAGMILLSCSYGDEKTGVFFNEKIFKAVSCTALCFYSLSKTYSFYTGANDLESIIPRVLRERFFLRDSFFRSTSPSGLSSPAQCSASIPCSRKVRSDGRVFFKL